MAHLESAQDGAALEQLLPGYAPLSALWEGEAPPFPSEYSARWALKLQRQALIDADALALLRGRIFIHRERFVQVVRQQAVDAYKQRFAAASR